MKRDHAPVKMNLLVVAWATTMLLAMPVGAAAFEIVIEVAPHVLNIQSDGEVVTVHTSINYSDVDTQTVYLNGVPISAWKADNQGNFVAKFVMEDIKSLPLIANDYNALTLDGVTVDGEPFFGVADIMVINVQPTGLTQ